MTTTQPDLSAFLPRLTGVWGPLGEALSTECTSSLHKISEGVVLHSTCRFCHGTLRVPLDFPQWGNGAFSGIVNHQADIETNADCPDDSPWWGIHEAAAWSDDDATLAALVAAVEASHA